MCTYIRIPARSTLESHWLSMILPWKPLIVAIPFLDQKHTHSQSLIACVHILVPSTGESWWIIFSHHFPIISSMIFPIIPVKSCKHGNFNGPSRSSTELSPLGDCGYGSWQGDSDWNTNNKWWSMHIYASNKAFAPAKWRAFVIFEAWPKNILTLGPWNHMDAFRL